MEKQIIISVVIPSYNREKTIGRTLASLVDQSFKDFEVIVSDDGSTDKTLEIVYTFQNKLNLKVIKQNNSGGPARPRNLAIHISNAPWIAFLDSDDWWYENKLASIIIFLDDHDVIFHDLDVMTSKGLKKNVIRGRNIEKDAFINLLIKGNAIANSSSIVRKQCVLDVGLIDESKELVAVEDYDLWLKLAKANKRFKYVNAILGAYLLEEGQNLTQKNERQVERYEAVVHKHLKNLSFMNQKKALALLSYSRARIYHALGIYSKAFENYQMAFSSCSVMIKLKSSFGLLLLILRNAFIKFNN